MNSNRDNPKDGVQQSTTSQSSENANEQEQSESDVIVVEIQGDHLGEATTDEPSDEIFDGTPTPSAVIESVITEQVPPIAIEPSRDSSMFTSASTQTTAPAPSVSIKTVVTSPLRGGLENMAPCERVHHVITINTTNSQTSGRQPELRTTGQRLRHTLNNFFSTILLCMQVNKDCMFCLGFFVAFVVSASFLTAFFYRTLNLSTHSVRMVRHYTTNAPIPLRINGGYYYVYNNNERQLHIN